MLVQRVEGTQNPFGLRGRPSKYTQVMPIREDDAGQPLASPAQIAEFMQTYFAQLEAGIIRSGPQLVDACNQAPLYLPPEAPRLVANVQPKRTLQRSFAKAASARPGGTDEVQDDLFRIAPKETSALLQPITTKVALLGREPFQAKGGIMIEVGKGKGSPHLKTDHRQILLGNVLPQHHHKWLRHCWGGGTSSRGASTMRCHPW